MRYSAVFSLLFLLIPLSKVPAYAETAREILEDSGVRGGLIVHLDCGNGKLTASLNLNDRCLVEGLDTSLSNITGAREWIYSQGLYGAVTVRHFDGVSLPYAENTVNLIAAEDPVSVPLKEIMRVLCPGGVLYTQSEEEPNIARKPWPEDMDEWTHYLNSASNNAVLKDSRVGPPRTLRWKGPPRWCRSHEFISSIVAMVCGGGRIFYVVDNGLTGVTDPRLPERWTLIARDSFNGVLLWKRPLPKWRGQGWGSTALRSRPAGIPRRMVADRDRLYITASVQAGVSVIEPATGKTLRSIPGTENAREMVLAGKTLLIRVASSGERRGKAKGAIVAADAESGGIKWRISAGSFRAQSLAAARGKVIYNTRKETVCVSLESGKELWRTKKQASRHETFILHGGFVVEGGRSKIVTRNAETGEIVWTGKAEGKSMRSKDVFVAGGCVWCALGEHIAGYDLNTGKIKEKLDPSTVQSPGHHLRCYRAKATERFLLTQYRGLEYISLNGGPHTQNDWLRGACRYGVMPSNGLIYVPPDPCFCYPGAKLTGFNAFAPAGRNKAGNLHSARHHLLKESSYRQAAELAQPSRGQPGRWPTYRHDGRRTGSTKCEVAPQVSKAWNTKLRGQLTPPVVSNSQLYVASKKENTLYALRVENGRRLWHYIAGGPIDSPPTIYGDLVLFGCADGCVYCLRASDGELLWRFRAVSQARSIVCFGRLESPWRVHGSVLVEDGLVYFTAGRSSFLDGGIRIFALDPATGRCVHETCLNTWSRTREDAQGKPFIPAHHIEGARSDVLVSQNSRIYVGQYKFNMKLAQEEVPYVLPGPEEKTEAIRVKGKPYTAQNRDPKHNYEKHQRRWLERTQKGLLKILKQKYGGWNLGVRRMGLHLITTSGFLDPSWFNRTFWTYSATWPGFYLAHRGAKTGQLLVVGPNKTYAVQAYPSRNLQSPLFTPGKKGYLLYADRNGTEPVLDEQTRGTPKGWGFTRTRPPVWFNWVPVRIRAMVLAGQNLFVAGPPDVVENGDPMASFEGSKGAVLCGFSKVNGKKLSELKLQSPPVFDGLIAAAGRLFLCTEDGRVVCFEPARN